LLFGGSINDCTASTTVAPFDCSSHFKITSLRYAMA